MALAIGLLLFIGGMGVALRRATGQWTPVRLGATGVTAVAIVALAGVPGIVSLLLALAGVTAVLVYEQRQFAGG